MNSLKRRDPFYYRNRRQRMMEQQERQGGMNFLEAIFRWTCWGREDGKMGGLAGWRDGHTAPPSQLGLLLAPLRSAATLLGPSIRRSFVFGDGDPNEDYDRKRWQAVRATAWLGGYPCAAATIHLGAHVGGRSCCVPLAWPH